MYALHTSSVSTVTLRSLPVHPHDQHDAGILLCIHSNKCRIRPVEIKLNGNK
jgi:hypothetical protein